jgi:CubicO group peptidase (beta-lactamase class C family)
VTRDVSAVPLGGWVDTAFGDVGDAFRSNFTPAADGSCDLGAAMCIVARGRVVADCWAGWRDAGAGVPWERETLVNAYSVLKPVTAALALRS